MASGFEVLIKVMAVGGKAVSEFEKVGKASERMAKKTDDSVKKAQISLDAFGKKAGIAGGALIAASASMVFALKGTVASAQEAEDAHLKLSNTIEGSARLAPSSMKAFEGQAKAIQKITVASDESVMGIQSILGQFNLTESRILTLTPLVVDISRKMGIDYTNAAKAVAKATDGSAGALKKLGINVDDAKFKLDPFAATVEALRRSSGGFAQQEGKTFAGQMAILGNQADDLKESLGRGVLSVMTDILPVVQNVAGAFVSLDDATGGAVGSGLAVVAGLAGLAGAGAIGISMILKVKAAYEKLAASEALAARGALAAIPVVGVAVAVAGVISVIGKLDDAINHYSDKAAASYARAFDVKTAKDATQAFFEAGLNEAQTSKTSFSNVFKGIREGADDLMSLHFSLPGFTKLAGEIGKSGLDKAFKKMLTLDPEAAKSIYDYIESHDKLKRQLVDLGVNLGDYKKWMKDAVDTNHDGKQSFEELVAAADGADKAMQGFESAVGSAGANSRLFTSASLAAADAVDGLKTAQQKYAEAVKSGDPAKIAAAQNDLAGAMVAVANANDAVTEAAIKQAEAQIDLQNLIKEPQAFVDAVHHLQDLADQMNGPLKNAIQSRIDQMVLLRLTAGQPIDLNDAPMLASLGRLLTAGQITQAQIDGLLKPKNMPAIESSGWLASVNAVALAAWKAQDELYKRGIGRAPGPKPKAITNADLAGGFTGLAAGGPVSGMKPYIVGERGPELFVPASAGRIEPNIGGGQTVNITVNASPLSSPADVGSAVVDALKAYERRNGSLPLKVA